MPYTTIEYREFAAALDFLVASRAEAALSYLHEEAMAELVRCVQCPYLQRVAGRCKRVFWVLDAEQLTWRRL